MSCLDETTSQALDVRLMKVAEALRIRANRIMGTDDPLSGIAMRDAAREVEDIAASIRAAMPDPRAGGAPAPPPPRTTATAIREMIQSATTEQALDEAWSDVAPTLPSLTLVERVSAVEAFITTMCRVSRDDGR
jgi:hypothetical protein